MYIKPWLSPVDAIILVPLVLFCDNWTISQISHCTFPYPTICNIQNKNAHIFVLNGVLCYMGHVHCEIYENSLFIISSGLAWCHHAPDLYLASNGHGRMAGCPTDLNGIRQLWFFSRERGEGAVRQALQQRHLCGTERAAHSTERQNMLGGGDFSVFDRLKPNFVCLLGNRVNDHPPTLTKIGQL